MSFANEFAAVDWLITSNLKTSGVDAFALSLIKAERQIRRIFTHLIFQNEAFRPEHTNDLRSTLVQNRRCYFEGFERGVDAILPISVKTLVGSEYEQLRPLLSEATDVRNKIFQGQLTGKQLTRNDLFQYVRAVRRWCELLAISADREIGYDGFERNSFRKGRVGIAKSFTQPLSDIAAYKRFLQDNVERRS